MAGDKLEADDKQKTEEILKLKEKVSALRETLIDMQVREKQYVLREDEAALRATE